MAVAAANCVNIPLMRRQEIVQGISIQAEDGTDAGMSSKAAIAAIGQVIPSRIGMVILLPRCVIIMHYISRSTIFFSHALLAESVR
jgi:hypothetical protein